MVKSKFLEKAYKKNLLYRGKSVDFRVDTIILPNHKKVTREFMVHPSAVAIIPIDRDGKIIFVRQYRYPVSEETIEIPAGKFINKNDEPLKRANAELEEETGYIAGKIKHLIDYWPTPAFSNEILKIYIAFNLKKGKKHPDEDEFLSTKKLTLSNAISMINKGKIKDSKTIIALLYYKIYEKEINYEIRRNR